MSNLEDRLTRLEKKLHRARILVVALLLGLLLVSTVAAAPLFGPMTFGSVTIRKEGIGPVIELKDNGDIIAKGGIVAKDVDILQKIELLEKKVQQLEEKQKNAIYYGSPVVFQVKDTGMMIGTHGNDNKDGTVVDVGPIQGGAQNYFTMARR